MAASSGRWGCLRSAYLRIGDFGDRQTGSAEAARAASAITASGAGRRSIVRTTGPLCCTRSPRPGERGGASRSAEASRGVIERYSRSTTTTVGPRAGAGSVPTPSAPDGGGVDDQIRPGSGLLERYRTNLYREPVEEFHDGHGRGGFTRRHREGGCPTPGQRQGHRPRGATGAEEQHPRPAGIEPRVRPQEPSNPGASVLSPRIAPFCTVSVLAALRGARPR